MINIRTATAQDELAMKKALQRERNAEALASTNVLAFDGNCKPLHTFRSLKGALHDPLCAHLRILSGGVIRWATKYDDGEEHRP